MAHIETLLGLYTQAGHAVPALPSPPPPPPALPPPLPPTASAITAPAVKASAYEAGGQGRRAQGWNPTTILGPTTVLWTSLQQIRARSRDQIRNSPFATSAIDNFESQLIGNGIRPRWNIEDPILKKKVEQQFDRWSNKCDSAGRLSFYGLQALAAREIFEAGEVFVRFHVRPSSWRMKVPLQLQLLESEQLPLFRNSYSATNNTSGVPDGNSVRTGIEFDSSDRRTAYWMYREHPGETMFYPSVGLSQVRIPAEDMLHVYKPTRAGLLRGVPHLTSVLTLLYELEQYTDAELVRKKVATMFAAFIVRQSNDGEIIPVDPNLSTPSGASSASSAASTNPAIAIGKLEPGTVNLLDLGEDIKFPTLPSDQGYEAFLRVSLHKFARGCNMTYEQVTGDLKGVNFSSIRTGLLDFRRACEQFQRNIIIFQLCQPVVERWMDEAIMSGAISLPGYTEEPEQYQDILWTSPGWDWVDPKADFDTAIGKVRAGFTTRAHEIAKIGQDIGDVDAEWKRDMERAHKMGLIYDSDPSQILIGRETLSEDTTDQMQGADGTSAPPTKKPSGGSGSTGPKLVPAKKAAELLSAAEILSEVVDAAELLAPH